jgi:ABC-2 type transport system ATP-binding protein
VRSAGANQVPGMTAESGGRWFVELRRSVLWSTLQEIENAGHTLIEVKPTLTLESAFLRYSGLGESGGLPKP